MAMRHASGLAEGDFVGARSEIVQENADFYWITVRGRLG